MFADLVFFSVKAGYAFPAQLTQPQQEAKQVVPLSQTLNRHRTQPTQNQLLQQTQLEQTQVELIYTILGLNYIFLYSLINLLL